MKKLFLYVALIFAASPVSAREISIPVRFDLSLIRYTFIEQFFNETGEKAVLLDDGRQCQWFYLIQPQVSTVNGKLRIISRADARLGLMVNDACIGPKPWKGFLDLYDDVQFDNQTCSIVLKLVDSHIYDDLHKKQLASGKLWDIVKGRVHERLGVVKIDFSDLYRNMQELLPLVLSLGGPETQNMLQSMKFRDIRIIDEKLELRISFEVNRPPPQTAGAPTAPEPALTAQEQQKWNQNLQRFDAFLTFVVKRLARTKRDDVKKAFLEVLLDVRYELARAVMPTQPGEPDPVLPLFIKTWERLAPLIRQLVCDMPQASAIQYLSFIAAGDAIAALNAIGPEAGFDLSADGLRRFARMIDPSEVIDPLLYSTDVDPELRKLFGLGPPLPPPNVLPEIDLNGMQQPQPGQRQSASYGGAVHNALARLDDILIASAWAGFDPEDLYRLNSWVPDKSDVPVYLPMMQKLLEYATDKALTNGKLDSSYNQLFGQMVMAVAWQESCWHQFVKNGDKLVPLRSTIGSVGLMQINERVWRGVYDPKGLLGDTLYNARAGCEILLHYLIDYSLAKSEHKLPGGIDNLPKATYAIYNGGPGQLARYRLADTKPALKKIDDLYWMKFTAVREAKLGEAADCF